MKKILICVHAHTRERHGQVARYHDPAQARKRLAIRKYRQPLIPSYDGQVLLPLIRSGRELNLAQLHAQCRDVGFAALTDIQWEPRLRENKQ